jgi:hypothetical protein
MTWDHMLNSNKHEHGDVLICLHCKEEHVYSLYDIKYIPFVDKNNIMKAYLFVRCKTCSGQVTLPHNDNSDSEEHIQRWLDGERNKTQYKSI